jgi:D-beta-D-heptose 7-phosphate kinase/D-beta-D-heptose 1-phosphate adenosyltransferase
MKNTSNPYHHFLSKFKHKKILVIGDLILDRYLQGNCTRLAPEATVPVIDVNLNKDCPGGAANVAANLSALWAETTLCSVIGADGHGTTLTTLLKTLNVNTTLIINDQDRALVHS